MFLGIVYIAIGIVWITKELAGWTFESNINFAFAALNLAVGSLFLEQRR